MMNAVKSLLKQIKPVYYMNLHAKACQTEAKVGLEMDEYSRLAHARGICYKPEAVRSSLRERLWARGCRAKPKGELHLAFVAPPSNWEPHNIPSQMARFGRVTLYYWKSRGFNDEDPQWAEKRRFLEADLVAFLLDVHHRHPIDGVFSYLSGRQVSGRVFQEIRKLGIFTCNFCLDDTLSFRGQMLGGRWTGPQPLVRDVDLNLTTSESSLIKYLVEGGLAAFWPEGANPDFFKPVPGNFEYEVSFVGGKYGYRPILVNYLRKHGISVATFGKGWPNGEVPSEELPKIFSHSRVNLGFGGIGYSMRVLHLKGRDFEIPMSGGLYLTTFNPELVGCYKIGREILCYRDRRDCLNQIRYFLTHPVEAETIRQAGYERAQGEHTWERRFEDVLTFVGLLEGGQADSLFLTASMKTQRNCCMSFQNLKEI